MALTKIALVVLVTSLMALHVMAVVTTSYHGCYEAIPSAPVFHDMAIFPQMDDPPIDCPEICLQLAYALAAISEGIHCQCSNADVALLVTAGTCEIDCNGSPCGSADNNLMSVYLTGGGSPNFTLTADNAAGPIAMTLTSLGSLQMSYMVNYGYGAVNSYYSAPNPPSAITTVSADDYLVPGNYTVSVMSMIEGTTLSETYTAELIQKGTPSIDAVLCPVVWEPDMEYFCNVSVTPEDGDDSYTASFDSTPGFVIKGIGSEVRRLGRLVPRDMTLEVGATGATGEVILVSYPVTKPSQLIAIDAYFKAGGPFTLSVKRPICAAGIYSVDVGGCMTTPIEDPLGFSHTCPAAHIFCPGKPTCSDGTTCVPAESSPTWADVGGALVTVVTATEGSHRQLYAAPIDLLPGDVIVASGPIAESLEAAESNGDSVGGIVGTAGYLVTAIIKEMLPIQVSHICTVVNTDVLLDVSRDVDTTMIMSNHTSCERIITDITLRIAQLSTDTFNPSANLADPYYIRSNEDADFTVSFSIAGPMVINFTFAAITTTEIDINDFPLNADGSLHELTYLKQHPTPGEYIVTTTAENQHNQQNPFLTLASHNLTLIVQHKVAETWVVAADDPIGFLIPPELGQFRFKNPADPTGTYFPTDATVLVTWGDGTPDETLPFVGSPEPVITHNYTQDGTYNVTAYISNVVSGYTVECQVLIVEAIINFEIANKYIVKGSSGDIIRDGFGKDKNQYPIDKNLTFFPSALQGTIDRYEVVYTINDSLITTFIPADNFDPFVDPFHYHFDYECFLNLTVKAINSFQVITFDIQVEIVGEVRGCELDDYSIVVGEGEEKIIMVAFESIGGGTCLLVDFGDTRDPLIPYSYGEETTCKKRYPDAIYDPNLLLDVVNNLTHVYSRDDKYNVTILAFNDLNNCSETIMTLVTSIKCRPPIVSIVDGTMDPELAPTFVRSEDNLISTIASIDCDLTSNTKKRWQLYHAESEPIYALGFPWTYMQTLPSWNTAHLMVPKNSLDYGLYNALYTITMWDPSIQVLVEWPFQKQVECLFQLVPGQLIGIVVEGSVSHVIRGPSQELKLQPCLLSIDPDYPDNKTFTAEYACRRIDETYADPLPDTKYPVFTKGTGGGCFGNGAGKLDHDSCNLTVIGSDFMGPGIYEAMGTVGKDGRSNSAKVVVEILDHDPPLIVMEFSDPSLVDYDQGFMYVNPCKRIGIRASCTDDCEEPHKHYWTVTDTAGVEFSYNPDHFPVGNTGIDLSFSPKFFEDSPLVQDLHIGVEVTAADGRIGGAKYFFKVNQKPVSGYCIIEQPSPARALIDTFYLECDLWVDPENKGIKGYVMTLIEEDNDDRRTVILEKVHTNVSPQREPLVFPPGTFTVEIKILDKWDACTFVNATTSMEVAMPTAEEYANADIEGLVAYLNGTGNTRLLNMLVLAQSEIAKNSPDLALDSASIEGLSDEEIGERIRRQTDILHAGLNILESNPNLATIDSVNVAASIMTRMIENTNLNREARKVIDSVARDKIVGLTERFDEAIENMDVPDPNDLAVYLDKLATTNTVLAKNQDEGSKREGNNECKPNPKELDHNLYYEPQITGIDMVMEEDEETEMKCNVLANTKRQAHAVVPSIDSSLNNTIMKIMRGMVAGETISVAAPAGAYVKLMLTVRRDLSVMEIGESGSKITLPDPLCPVENCTMDTIMGAIIQEWDAVAFSYLPGVEKLCPGTKVLSLKLLNADLEVIPLRELPDEKRFTVHLPRTPGVDGNMTVEEMNAIDAIEESKTRSIPVIYTTFDLMNEGSALTLQISVEDTSARLFLFVHNLKLPTFKEHIYYQYLKRVPVVDGRQDIFLLASELGGHGRYFMGIGEFEDGFDVKKVDGPGRVDVPMTVTKVLSTNFKVRFITDNVAYINVSISEWDSYGLEVIGRSDRISIFKSNHLTSFGAGMFVAPNTIDFNYVFANMGFLDNVTIYVTIIISIALLLILMIWARYKDKKDKTKLGASPLPDNKVEDKYLYEVLVVTGNYKEAQTDSNVQFLLSGEDDETDVRTLADDSRKTFRKDSVDVYVMAVTRPLGPLQFLRIWHDNSGKGPNASWHLAFIVFRDIQTGEKFEFINNQWLAVEKDDGQIERLIPVAGAAQRREFQHLFHNTANKNLADGHLWFSVFLRPHRSRYTRCQRVASCFALLFLSMLVNAMWYERVPDKAMSGGLNIGPFSLSPEQIGIGVISNLIVFPPSIIIVFLFRVSRPRKLRKNRIVLAVKKTKMDHRARNGEDAENLLEDEEEQSRTIQDGNKVIVIEKKEKKKKKFSLPWFFVILAWILVVVCIAASLFFLLMYGIQFGNNKTTQWVTSLVISFFSSVLFIQPLKIFIMTMLLSAICKKGDLDEDDADEDEEDPYLDQDEAWLHPPPGGNRRSFEHKKVDEEMLAKLRNQRRKEVEMWKILKEIFTYCIFLWTFLTLSYGNRDPNAYFLRKNLQNSFIFEGNLDGLDFTKVTNADRFWHYLREGLMTSLHVGRLYNGRQPYFLRGYLNDQSNRLMGHAIIRQVRSKHHACRVPTMMRMFTRDCSGYTNIVDEDGDDYCASWTRPSPYTWNTSVCEFPEFKYKKAAELEAFPLWGARVWYGGGGYVVHLVEDTKTVLKKLHTLQQNRWIDRHTRAVLIEFSTYNPQVNLFGLCLIMAEFTPGGGISPYFRFEGVRLINYLGGFAAFEIFCQVVFCLFVIYFTVRELYNMYKEKCGYWSSYWSFAEVSILLACYTGITLYVLRYFATQDAMRDFELTKGNGYIRMQYAALLDECYGYSVGFVVFVGTLKFIKLLRFNKRMGVLSATLAQCWDDLSGFLMAFFICFFSFVTMFYLLLFKSLNGFYNIVTAVETCFSMMLGKFQFEEMKQVSPFVPLMFFVFVVCNSWVLINLLLTLIIKSFTEVKYDLAKQPNEYEMVAFIMGRFRSFLGLSKPVPAPIPLTTTTTRRDSDTGLDGQSNEQNTVHELPSKVDRFLEHINVMYFNGNLDVSNKDMLKSSMARQPNFPNQGPSGARFSN